MQVNVKVICRDMLGGFAGGSAEVPAPATAQQAVLSCLDQAGIAPVDALFDNTLCMRNDRAVQWSDPVEEGDRVYVLHKIMGG